MKKYRPIRDRVVIRVDKVEKVSAGGIILGDNETERDSREEGIVLALGSTVYYDTPEVKDEVKVGDRVMFSKYAGKTCGKDEDGFPIVAMRDIDIICVVEEE